MGVVAAAAATVGCVEKRVESCFGDGQERKTNKQGTRLGSRSRSEQEVRHGKSGGHETAHGLTD